MDSTRHIFDEEFGNRLTRLTQAQRQEFQKILDLLAV